jgi:hypothetical protein
MEDSCAHFLLLPSLLFSSFCVSIHFYSCRALNVHNWAFDFIRFFDPLCSLCVCVSLSLRIRLGIGLSSSRNFSGEDGEKTETVIPSNEHGRALSRKSFASQSCSQ